MKTTNFVCAAYLLGGVEGVKVGLKPVSHVPKSRKEMRKKYDPNGEFRNQLRDLRNLGCESVTVCASTVPDKVFKQYDPDGKQDAIDSIFKTLQEKKLLKNSAINIYDDEAVDKKISELSKYKTENHETLFKNMKKANYDKTKERLMTLKCYLKAEQMALQKQQRVADEEANTQTVEKEDAAAAKLRDEKEEKEQEEGQLVRNANPTDIVVSESERWTGERDNKSHQVFLIQVGDVKRKVRKSTLNNWDAQFPRLKKCDEVSKIDGFLRSLSGEKKDQFRHLLQSLELPSDENKIFGLEPKANVDLVGVDGTTNDDYAVYQMKVNIDVWKMDVGGDPAAAAEEAPQEHKGVFQRFVSTVMDTGRTELSQLTNISDHAHAISNDSHQIEVRHSELRTLVESIVSKVPDLHHSLQNTFWGVESGCCSGRIGRFFAWINRSCQNSKTSAQQRQEYMKNTVQEILENRHLFDRELYKDMCTVFLPESQSSLLGEVIELNKFKAFLQGRQ